MVGDVSGGHVDGLLQGGSRWVLEVWRGHDVVVVIGAWGGASGMAGEIRMMSGAGAVGAEESMLESCTSVGDALWWKLKVAGGDVGVLEFVSDGVVGLVGSWW